MSRVSEAAQRMEITRPLGILSGGVTQQPAFTQFPNQFKEAVNVSFSVVDGMSRRPGTFFERKISQVTSAFEVDVPNKIHCIERDANERYRVVLGYANDIMQVRVFEVGGPESSVVYKSGEQDDIEAYLALNTPTGQEIRCLTVADGTILVNTKAPTGLLASDTYTVSRVHKNTNLMVLTTPATGSYHQAKEDGVDFNAGYFRYDNSAAQGRTFPTFEAIGNGALRWNGWGTVQGTGNEWTSATPAACRLGFRRVPVTATGATVTNASGDRYTIASTGAFTNYTFEAGDQVRITSGATFPAGLSIGWATVVSRDSNNQITVDAAPNTSSFAPGLSCVLSAGSVNISGIGREYGISVSLASKISAGDIRDLDDIASELTEALRDAGEPDALIGWKPSATGAGGYFVVTGPWAGSNAIIYNPLPPLTGAGGSGDMTMGGRPFETATGGSIFTAGSSPGPGDATSTRVPIKTRWTSVSAPGQPENRPDPAKMPVLLRRNTFTGDGTTPATFTLELIPWDTRLSGDELTNKAPKLLKNATKISDILFCENRLVLCGGPYVLASATNDLFRFYKDEDVNLVDSDPFEIEVGDSSVPNIYRIAMLNRTMVALTDAGVAYELSSDGPWTSTSVGVTPGLRYNTLDVAPLSMDGRLYIACNRKHGPQSWPATQVIEYDYDDFRAKNAGFDTTAHIPTYINTAATKLAGIVGDGVIVMVKTTAVNSAYLYQTYFGPSNQRQQAAWSKITFGADDRLVDMTTTKDEIVLLMQTGTDDLVIETLSWNRDFHNAAMKLGTIPYLPCMDRMIVMEGTLNAGNTEWTLPFTDTGQYGAINLAGLVAPMTRVSGGLYRVTGDIISPPAGPLTVVGKVYTTEAILSEQYLRDQSGVVIIRGDVNIRSITVVAKRFGPFSTIITRNSFETPTTHVAAIAGVNLIEEADVPIFSIGPSNTTQVKFLLQDQRPMTLQTILVEGEAMDRFSATLRV